MITYKSLDEVRTAVKQGCTVQWKNDGYTVKESKSGDFNVVCFNGHCAYLSNDYHAGDFYSHTKHTHNEI